MQYLYKVLLLQLLMKCGSKTSLLRKEIKFQKEEKKSTATTCFDMTNYILKNQSVKCLLILIISFNKVKLGVTDNRFTHIYNSIKKQIKYKKQNC